MFRTRQPRSGSPWHPSLVSHQQRLQLELLRIVRCKVPIRRKGPFWSHTSFLPDFLGCQSVVSCLQLESLSYLGANERASKYAIQFETRNGGQVIWPLDSALACGCCFSGKRDLGGHVPHLWPLPRVGWDVIKGYLGQWKKRKKKERVGFIEVHGRMWSLPTSLKGSKALHCFVDIAVTKVQGLYLRVVALVVVI